MSEEIKETERKIICTDLEHITKDTTICPKIIERIVAIMTDPLKLVELGPALPMLGVLIQTSREQDVCQVSYSEIAKKCGVTAGTIKNWGKELEQRGYIQKTNRGHCGLIIKINDCKIGKADIFSGIMKMQNNSVKVLDAVRLTMTSAISSAIAELQQGREAVI
jgi:transposase-like protein